MEGNSPALQKSLHDSARWSGLVAHLTSVRPLPQAEEDTSHRKANAAVTTRSWQRTVHSKYTTYFQHTHTCHMSIQTGLTCEFGMLTLTSTINNYLLTAFITYCMGLF